jgi:hypothetical protein
MEAREVFKMSEILNKEPLFIFVFTYLMPYRNMPYDFKIIMTEKICKKLKQYGHDKKQSNIKELYVRYYISGYLGILSFNQIISDPAFHSEDYESSKKFFLEVYFGNKNLIEKFSSERNLNPFLNSQTKKEYLEWLDENFKICYDNYYSFSRK